MKKIKFRYLLLLFVPSILFAGKPHYIHYSSIGNYLVNENGEKTIIEGNPMLICQISNDTKLAGIFIKQDGATIYVDANKIVKIEKPVCDVFYVY